MLLICQASAKKPGFYEEKPIQGAFTGKDKIKPPSRYLYIICTAFRLSVADKRRRSVSLSTVNKPRQLSTLVQNLSLLLLS